MTISRVKKRFISLILAVVMFNGLFTVCAEAAAVNDPPASQTITIAAGLDVTYATSASWGINTRNATITIHNNTSEILENWSLTYKSSGKISNIQNAEIYKNYKNVYLIRHQDHNHNIPVGGSVEFTYVLNGGDMTVPEFIYSSKRIQHFEGFDVSLDYVVNYDNFINGTITLKNTSDIDLNAWQLSFSMNFTTSSVWNAELIKNTIGHFQVEGGYLNTNIPMGSEAGINFSGTMSEAPEISNPIVSVIEYDESDFDRLSKEEDKNTKKAVIASAECTDGENVGIVWYSTLENVPVEIYASQDLKNGAEPEFTKIATVENSTAYTYKITAPFEEKLFKVRQNYSANKSIESPAFKLTGDNGNYTVEEPDTDSDGLPDFLESFLGLSSSSDDTDNDGLPDSTEINSTFTDPTVFDSVKSGVSDADADADNDNLSSTEELTAGTIATEADTDGDGLTDGEEIKVYHTNPVDTDTDIDGISDNDEILLGLNPNSAVTGGVKDSERTFTYNISSDDTVLDYVNTSDNPYQASVNLTAAGNIATSLTAVKSKASDAIRNDAMLGNIAEFSYPKNLSVTDFEVRFTIDDDYIRIDDDGLQRYVIFEFDKDNETLAPINTNYDTASGTISAKTDRLGIYAVMDMNELKYIWDTAFAPDAYIESEYDYTDDSEELMQNFSYDTQILRSKSIINAAQTETEADEMPKADVKDGVNIIFMYDNRGVFDKDEVSLINSELQKVYETASFARNCKDARIFAIDIGFGEGQALVYNNGKQINKLNINYHGMNETPEQLIYSDALKIVSEIAEENSDYQTYVFSVLDENNLYFKYPSGKEYANACKEQGVIISDILPITIDEIGFLVDTRNDTGGIHIDSYVFGDEALRFIFDDYEKPLPNNGKTFIMSANLMPIDLSEAPNTDSYMAYLDVTENPDNYSYYLSSADTDEDGLYDFLEIDYSNYRFNSGDIFFEDDEIYFSSVSDYIKAHGIANYFNDEHIDYPMLPVKTDPTSKDRDGDRISDLNDTYAFYDDRTEAYSGFLFISDASELSYITLGSATGDFMGDTYFSSSDQQFYFSDTDNGYRINSVSKYGLSFTAFEESESFYALRASENYFNVLEQYWDIIPAGEGLVTIKPRSYLFKDTSISSWGLLNENNNKLKLSNGKDLTPPVYDENNRVITIYNYKDSDAAKNFFTANIWPILRHADPSLDDVSLMGAYVEWAHDNYNVIDGNSFIENYLMVRACTEDAITTTMTYWVWGVAEGTGESIKGTVYTITHPIETIQSALSLLDEETRTQLIESIEQQILDVANLYSTGESYAKARHWGNVSAELLLEIVTDPMADKILSVIKSNKKIMASVTVIAGKVQDAMPILRKIADLGANAQAAVTKVINNIGKNAKYVYAKLANKIDDFIDIFTKYGDNVNFTASISRIADFDPMLALKTRTLIYKGLENYSDDLLTNFSYSVTKFPEFGDVIENMPSELDNIVREVFDSGDVDGKVSALSKAYNENGVAGVRAQCEAWLCFTAETLITTENGHVRIENIKTGDRVYSFDSQTGDVSVNRVLSVEKHPTNEIVHVTTSGNKTLNETINATPEHPFYVPVKGWTNAVNLRAGDVLYTLNGEYVVVEQVQHEILEKPVWVYNFEVASDHTYFVGENAVGVHNECDVPQWSNYDFKHAPPKNIAWKDIVKSTKNGPAKYSPDVNIKDLEMGVWGNGINVTNNKSWKVMEFDNYIGACNGIETRYVRVELTAGIIHGHPISYSEYIRLIR